MKALITGASSGLGREMARILSERGYDIIAVARREERLAELAEELPTSVETVCMDVTDIKSCIKLSEYAKEVDVFINNAGFGVFGDFCSNSLESELKMLETNVRSVHILTKLFVREFKKRNSGYILNVSSLASFFPGPLFSAYYASKSYVLRLTQGISEELRREGSKVKLSVLCPGPVKTEFGKVAGVSFGNGGERGRNKVVLNCRQVSMCAINGMFKGKTVIIPGFIMKVAAFCRHIFSDKLLAKTVYMIQNKKCITDEHK